MGDRWDRQNKWNLREENSDTGETIKPKLSILRERDDAVELILPYFGNDRGSKPSIIRKVPVKKIKIDKGVKLVTENAPPEAPCFSYGDEGGAPSFL